MAGPLISAAELTRRIDDPELVVIDCRWYLGEPDEGRRAYDAGHLPGAFYASLDEDLSGHRGEGRHPLPEPGDFSATMERFGIAPDTCVVAYDDRGGAIAARLWWMLTEQGHTQALVLDGGLQAWLTHGGDLTRESPAPRQGSFTSRPWSDTVDRAAVAGRDPDVIVIDARSDERYAGIEEPIDPKAGHIPGAVSLPMTENLRADQSMLDADVLRQRFEAAGITATTRVISQCGSGVTACHNILALEVAGLPRPQLYVGSWSDWSSSGLPVATGVDP